MFFLSFYTSKSFNMSNVDLSREFLQACHSGDLSRVETLASKYDVKDWTLFRYSTSGDTGLHVATREGHLNIARYLCESFNKPDMRVDVVNKDTKRPLHEAAQFSRSPILNYLIEKGASVDALKRGDWTPLMLACTKIGNEANECILALLRAQANVFLKNKDGWTPFHMICRSGNVQAFEIFVKKYTKCIYDRSNNGRSSIHIAAFHGHEELIERLVKLDTKFLNVRDSSGSTPLHEAMKNGHLNVVKLIVKLGADIKAVDNVGQTVLHVAALTGNVEAIKYILDNNLIDVNSEAMFNVTPLIAARRSNKKDTIECLLKYEAVK